MDIKNGIDKIVSQVGKKDKLEKLLYNSTGFNKLMSPVYNMRTALAVAHDAEDYGVDSYKT